MNKLELVYNLCSVLNKCSLWTETLHVNKNMFTLFTKFTLKKLKLGRQPPCKRTPKKNFKASN